MVMQTKQYHTQKLKNGLSTILICLVVLLLPAQTLLAQARPGDAISCSQWSNFSKSPDHSSVDPLLLTDPSGLVHLFWAERITGGASSEGNAPDAVMYAVWNGESWSLPVDLFLSPREFYNRRVNALRGVVDESGYLHITWSGPDGSFFYSSAHASQARQSTAWLGPTYIALDHSGGQYTGDINYSASGTLHIVYGRLPTTGSNEIVTHIRSTDGGQTWSTPKAIYTIPYKDRGASNIRVWTNGPDNVYATWTEWDSSGNGQGIYFARSLDNGLTWEPPYQLAERKGLEYERDWVTLAVLGENELVAFWEGGYRAYRQAQYSYDGGETWTDPIDTLDWLIADNGFAEFVRDGDGRLHLFVFQRIREGNTDRNPFVTEETNGLWHSFWQGGQEWRQPQLIGEPNGGNFAAVTIRGGNELFAAWFSYTGLELYVGQCQLKDTSPIPLQAWTEVPPRPLVVSEDGTAVAPTATPFANSTATHNQPASQGTSNNNSPNLNFSTTTVPLPNPSNTILTGVIPVIVVILLVTAVSWFRRRQL